MFRSLRPGLHAAKTNFLADLLSDRNAECRMRDQAHLLVWPLAHEW